MKKFVESGEQLTSEGRNLLSVAYKNVVGSRRNAWRVITGNIQQMKEDDAKSRATVYQKFIEDELTVLCEEVVVCFSSLLLCCCFKKKIFNFFIPSLSTVILVYY